MKLIKDSTMEQLRSEGQKNLSNLFSQKKTNRVARLNKLNEIEKWLRQQPKIFMFAALTTGNKNIYVIPSVIGVVITPAMFEQQVIGIANSNLEKYKYEIFRTVNFVKEIVTLRKKLNKEKS